MVIPAIFIKPFKAGSSTVTALFHAIAQDGIASIYVPHRGDHTTSSKERALHALSLRRDCKSVDYWAYHASYEPWLHDVVAKDAKIVSVVRDPVKRFESHYFFFKDRGSDRHGPDISSFVLSADEATLLDAVPRFVDQSFPNERDVAHRIGHDPNWCFLVTERMAESAVVLADFLQWPVENATLCAAKRVRDPTKNARLNEAAADRIREVYDADHRAWMAAQAALDWRIAVIGESQVAKRVADCAQRSKPVILDNPQWIEAFWDGAFPHVQFPPTERNGS